MCIVLDKSKKLLLGSYGQETSVGLVEKNLNVPKIFAKFLTLVISSKFYIGLWLTYNSNE